MRKWSSLLLSFHLLQGNPKRSLIYPFFFQFIYFVIMNELRILCQNHNVMTSVGTSVTRNQMAEQSDAKIAHGLTELTRLQKLWSTVVLVKFQIPFSFFFSAIDYPCFNIPKHIHSPSLQA